MTVKHRFHFRGFPSSPGCSHMGVRNLWVHFCFSLIDLLLTTWGSQSRTQSAEGESFSLWHYVSELNLGYESGYVERGYLFFWIRKWWIQLILFIVGYLGLFLFTFLWKHVVQSLSQIWLFATPCAAALQASPSLTVFQSLLKLMPTESAMPSNYLLLCHPLLLLASIFPRIKTFSNDLALHFRWPKHWSFSNSPCNEYSGLISLRSCRFALLAVQGTLKSLLQHTIGKHQFFGTQPSL